MNMTTLEQVRELLAEHLDVDVETVKEDSTFEDLDIDSLDAVEIMMELEDAFGIEIAPAEAGKSVTELVKYIDSKKA
jgi:acyl carrier protein